MITDKECLCSEVQLITGPAVSTDSIMTGGLYGADRNRNLRLIAEIEVGLSGGSATGIVVEAIQADNAALTVNVEALGSTGVIANGPGGKNVARGTRPIDVALPGVTKPFLGFRYTPQGGSYTAGAITAGVVLDTETPVEQRPRAHSSWA